MKTLLLLMLIASPTSGQIIHTRSRSLDIGAAADTTIRLSNPSVGVPLSFLRPLAPSGHITVRATTYSGAPWGDQDWLSQLRISGSTITVYVFRAQVGHACSIGSFTLPAAPNQSVTYDLDLAPLLDGEILVFEVWPAYEIHLTTQLPSYGISEFRIGLTAGRGFEQFVRYNLTDPTCQ